MAVRREQRSSGLPDPAGRDGPGGALLQRAPVHRGTVDGRRQGRTRADVVWLLPAQMVTADMKPDTRARGCSPCHVGDHITVGVATRFRVLQ
jgi:FtsP/CotA-like multicopper oxidase with cupredoxin domain